DDINDDAGGNEDLDGED
ncbi:unnamed protein product, partial [Rotaria magnacalcarata]